jgi:ketosteroid isomerase-like protein
MSQENVELVRAGYAEVGGLASQIAPDAEFDLTGLYPDQPVLRGIKALRRFREEGPWGGSRLHFEPERFFDVDEERVLVFVRVTATGRQSGASVEIQGAHVVTIRDGLIVRFKAYSNRDQALEAVGLRE